MNYDNALHQTEMACVEVSVLFQAIGVTFELTEGKLAEFKAAPADSEPGRLTAIADEFDRLYAIVVAIGGMIDRLCTSSTSNIKRTLDSLPSHHADERFRAFQAEAVPAMERLARAQEIVKFLNASAVADSRRLRGAASNAIGQHEVRVAVDSLMQRMRRTRRSDMEPG